MLELSRVRGEQQKMRSEKQAGADRYGRPREDGDGRGPSRGVT